jgi:hypothetical protein
LTGGVTSTRIRWGRLAGALAVMAAIAAAGAQVLASPRSPAAPVIHVPRREHHHRPAPLGEAAGAVPAGTTVFDDAVPGVARLDPALLRALRRAAVDARHDGIAFVVNSGWRSAAYEDQLRREAVAKYGSEAEAARWVATGATSPHVSGDAVDLGPPAATQWLAARGAAYGLCQIYANEPWHYELRPAAIDRGCPAMYADPTQDPRLEEHP